MIPEDKAKKSLEKLKLKYKTEFPILIQLLEIQSISKYSEQLINSRIEMKKYNDRFALKRTFYKPIALKYPKYHE